MLYNIIAIEDDVYVINLAQRSKTKHTRDKCMYLFHHPSFDSSITTFSSVYSSTYPAYKSSPPASSSDHSRYSSALLKRTRIIHCSRVILLLDAVQCAYPISVMYQDQ